MIDPKELRIGNYLLNGKGIREIASIDTFDLSHYIPGGEGYQSRNKIEDYNPIPITPEILFSVGFVETYKSDYTHKFDADELGIGQIGYTWRFSGEPTFRYYSENNAPCKYLHQLQNLVFSLTGVELKIFQVEQ